MPSIGITGASGFIGRNLVEYFKNKNIDSYSISQNLFDYELGSVDALIHLAAINRGNEQQMFQVNVQNTMHLVNHCSDKNKRIVMAGSQYEHAMFGATKKICAETFKLLSPIYLNGTYVSLPHVFGQYARPNYNSFVTTIMHSIANNKEYESKILNIHEQLELIHIDDVCNIFDRLVHESSSEVIEKQINCGVWESNACYNVWHDGQFRMSIKDFIKIAKGGRTNYSEKIHDTIAKTMRWYVEDSQR